MSYLHCSKLALVFISTASHEIYRMEASNTYHGIATVPFVVCLVLGACLDVQARVSK